LVRHALRGHPTHEVQILQFCGVKSLTLNPHNTVIRENLARLYYNLGIYLNNQGKAQEAIAAYREAIRLTPNSTPPYNALAFILASHGKSDKAILLYKKAVKIDPDLWETQTNLGTTLWHQGRLDEAIEHYREAIRSNPDYVRAYYRLSNVFIQKGQKEEANALKEKVWDLQIKTRNVPNNSPY